jgi:RimJ/RimL family protein N-acetyltransferase
MIEGAGFRLRPAEEADVPYLVALAAKPEVADFLAAVSPWDEDDVRAGIAESRKEPSAHGRLVLEVAEAEVWHSAGALAFSVANRRSRVAYLFGVMVDPAFRGRGLAEQASRLLSLHLIHELRYHRVQLEVYGFNERAQQLFERAGFVREGVRRKAYWRHGAWTDGILYGLVEEDLGSG